MNVFQILALTPLLAACATVPVPIPGRGASVTLVDQTPAALVYLVTWTAPDGRDTEAGVVLPKATPSGPGILYFHQLGAGHDWRQFLDEAVAAASLGVRSVLIHGTVPWDKTFTGDATDQTKIDAQMDELRRAVDLLVNLPGVDQSRLGFVGHDYGAMYGALLSVEKTLITRFVLITPAPTWETWISYFQHHRDLLTGYALTMAPWDPLPKVAASPEVARLIQLSHADQFLTADEQAAWKAVGKGAMVTTLESSSHNTAFVDGAAERQKWLYQPWGVDPR